MAEDLENEQFEEEDFDGGDEEGETEEGHRAESMPALADAMAHVLAKKPHASAGPILARSKSTLKRLQDDKREKRSKKARAPI